MWELTDLYQQAAVFDAFGEVDAQNINGRSSNGCDADKHRTVPLEMLTPNVLTRMKKRRQFVRFRIESGDVRSLVRIAVGAGQAEIGGRSQSVVFLRANMVHLMRQNRTRLRKLTVLASSLGSLLNLVPMFGH